MIVTSVPALIALQGTAEFKQRSPLDYFTQKLQNFTDSNLSL